MPVLNNEQHLRAWLRKCPALVGTNRFRVDYLSERPTEYAIYAQPSTISYTENVLGERVPKDRQVINFIFASKENFGADETQNLANYAFYQDVVDWITAQNAAQNFPNLNEGTITSLVPTLTQYVSAPGTDSAKYQIQIQITYKRY